MVKTCLSNEERTALVERIAGWSLRLGIAPMVVFLVECNRPLAPLTANMLIGAGSLAETLLPLPLRDLGLLLLDDDVAAALRKRIDTITATEEQLAS